MDFVILSLIPQPQTFLWPSHHLLLVEWNDVIFHLICLNSLVQLISIIELSRRI